MKRSTAFAALAFVLSITPLAAQTERPARSLTSFRSDRAFTAYFQALSEEYRRREDARLRAQMEAQAKALAACGSKRTVAWRTTTNGSTVVHGVVRNVSGQEVAHASVMIPALGIRTQATTNGAYRFEIPADSLTSERTITMRTMLIGYLPRTDTITIAASASAELDLYLCPVPTSLTDVVTTGTASFAKNESVTNTQHAGVDEGGIVKLHGDYLIVLRRGRLFTVHVGDARLRRVSQVDAFAPGVDGRDDWYDELLAFEDKVIVVGYSYARGGTEINVFRIDDWGRLTYQSSHQLRSNDYYSSRNYASRLIGSKLVFYAPLYVPFSMDHPVSALPALRRWDRSVGGGEFRRIAPAQRVYRSPATFGVDNGAVLHTVTSCDLREPELTCEASVVVGPPGRVFYVSPSAVYVWLSEWRREARDTSGSGSVVFRLPLDGSAPTALGVRGSPVDQFSFLEADGYLNVAVRSDSYGDGMWSAEVARGWLALMRVRVRDFGDGTVGAPPAAYSMLALPPTTHHRSFTNRFVGDFLVYGAGNGWGVPRDAPSQLFVAPINGRAVTQIVLSHPADRIEVMGNDAVVIGSNASDLAFTGIRLGWRPRIGQQFTLREASQGELRSHGFFYKPNDASTGILGLPVRRAGRAGYEHLFESSAAVVFFHNDGDRFEQLGDLGANDERVRDDRCKASCVDWYGNSRPLFFRGRTFALLGYELVEGVVDGNRIREVRRVNFAP